MEKNVMRSLEMVAKERMEVAVSLQHGWKPFEASVSSYRGLATIVTLG
jgi:hypothetical protein